MLELIYTNYNYIYLYENNYTIMIKCIIISKCFTLVFYVLCINLRKWFRFLCPLDSVRACNVMIFLTSFIKVILQSLSVFHM